MEKALAFPKLKPLKNDLLESTSGRLELVAQYKLNGNVASMGIIRTVSPRGKQGCDSLLLAFNDAKVQGQHEMCFLQDTDCYAH